MNINRHNYEEFFLLYVDGELAAPQRLEVEKFVEQNVDLRNELQLLLQTKIDANDLQLEDKNFLYQLEEEGVNTDNHVEKFLLYVDDELTPSAKAAVETFVLQHPQVQESFTLLKQTKFEAETIVFANKESLYRKEKEDRPVVYLNWRRMAAIAAAVLFGLFIWKFAFTSHPTIKDEGFASNNNHVNQNSNHPIHIDTTVTPVKNNQQRLNSVDVKHDIAVTKDVNNKQKEHPSVATVPTKDNPSKELQQNNSPSTNIAKNGEDKIYQKQVPVDVQKTSANNVAIIDNSKHNINQSPVVVPTTATNTASIAATQKTIYRDLNTDDDDDDKSVYVAGVKLNKNKAGGLFKKAKQLLTSQADDDNNTIAIANIGIKKKSID
jgi:hypothetical protein